MDKFTRNELNRVDQYEHAEALFTLRHSQAAREVFAHLQYISSFGGEFFDEAMAYARALECISVEVLLHHRWACSRLNPRRVFAASQGRFMRLAEALGTDVESDKYRPNRSHVKTILGWWTV